MTEGDDSASVEPEAATPPSRPRRQSPTLISDQLLAAGLPEGQPAAAKADEQRHLTG
ncbi:hypothetical protein PsalMR5_00244 [Piscirickettsia salmonis]|uniref:hypothetical protein n=1 Tax=Piscirickettsia salmonis TaxID=1238 RepID=UPI0012BA6CFB|nr:hypothetical protein [Piscirickettsia salmonis]QGP52847.1 hypothetical protein PsalSR1_00240 [Piscirickettsia salmonis]QGP61231.1 hypothetical protein PsalBI1_03866 [Piscirickettsia salmonis]QGP62419.1 hypothetical protein PsalMR5_00244 [Piscirickettsia salmonis]